MLRRLYALRHLPSTPLCYSSSPSALLRSIRQQSDALVIRETISVNSRSYRTSLRNSIAGPSTWRTQIARSRQGQRYNSTGEGAVQQAPVKKPGRLKELAQKYGWAAFGVYMALSALDFPFCFLAVRWIGTERIAEAEHFVVSNFWRLVGTVLPNIEQTRKATAGAVGEPQEAVEEASSEVGGHHSHEGASLWTQLLLAYGVHKSLIVFRVPLTAALLPKVAKFLRARGWNVGMTKAEKVAKNAR